MRSRGEKSTVTRRWGSALMALVFCFASLALGAGKSASKHPEKTAKAARLAKNGKTARKPGAEEATETPSEVGATETTPAAQAPKSEAKPESPGDSDDELDRLTETLVDSRPLSLIALSARLDTNFLAGNGVVQGFSLPSVRVSVQGDVSPYVSYRVSAGQTREFATALLPVLTPVEGYIDLSTADRREAVSRATVRAGMFTPTFNPWWTPDLSGVDAPDYHESHRAIFLSRDLGAEAAWKAGDRSIELGAGAFNGIGIFGQNTNNSRAFTGHLSVGTKLFGADVRIGGAAYGRFQASLGNVNYRRQIIGNGWVSLTHSGWELYLDVFGGQYDDSVRSLLPFGGSAVVLMPLTAMIRLFGRAEWLERNPSGNGGRFSRFQVGPWIVVGEHLQGWLTYSNQVTGDGSGVTHTTEFRVRLDI